MINKDIRKFYQLSKRKQKKYLTESELKLFKKLKNELGELDAERKRMTNQETIIQDLIHNAEYYKHLLKDIKVKKDEASKSEPLYTDAINKQYKDLIKWLMAGILTGRYGISVEEIVIVLEDLNLEEYLK